MYLALHVRALLDKPGRAWWCAWRLAKGEIVLQLQRCCVIRGTSLLPSRAGRMPIVITLNRTSAQHVALGNVIRSRVTRRHRHGRAVHRPSCNFSHSAP